MKNKRFGEQMVREEGGQQRTQQTHTMACKLWPVKSQPAGFVIAVNIVVKPAKAPGLHHTNGY